MLNDKNGEMLSSNIFFTPSVVAACDAAAQEQDTRVDDNSLNTNFFVKVHGKVHEHVKKQLVEESTKTNSKIGVRSLPSVDGVFISPSMDDTLGDDASGYIANRSDDMLGDTIVPATFDDSSSRVTLLCLIQRISWGIILRVSQRVRRNVRWNLIDVLNPWTLITLREPKVLRVGAEKRIV